MKVIVLTRGGLPVSCLLGMSNPYSDARLNWQKSAEAIVLRLLGGRAEQQRFWNLKDSREMQRKQTIPKGNSLREVGVEHRDSAEALSISAASKRRKNDMQEVEEDLLERILARGNLNAAYQKVISNKGSHGVDGMKVDELLPYLKQHGEGLRQRHPMQGNMFPNQ